MTYLIAEIWLFIAFAAAIGLLFGWMFRGGVSGARLRELRHRLAHAEAEAAEQRREAAELAARAERRTRPAPTAEDAHAQVELRTARDHISRLEVELRSARSEADRYSEEADELRFRLAEASSQAGEIGDTAGGEFQALRGQVEELEAKANDLVGRLERRDAEVGDPLRRRIAELEAEQRQLREAPPSAVPVVDEASQNRIAELEREVEALRARPEPPPAEPNRDAEEALHARVAELEGEVSAFDARLSESRDDARAPLLARIGELENELAQASASPAANPVSAEESGKLRETTLQLEAMKGEADRVRDEVERLRGELAARASQDDEATGLRATVADLETSLAATREAAAAAEERARAARPEMTLGGVDVNGGVEEVLRSESARMRWRANYLTSRIHFLEAQVRDSEKTAETAPHEMNGSASADVEALRAENEKLAARVREFEERPTEDRSAEPPPNVEGGGGSLEWRNRYLASRVRYLELQLEETAEGGRSPSEEDLRVKLAQAQAEAAEAVKLRARVSELERGNDRSGRDDESPAKSEGEFALEWRNRYLSSRVKYLEDRLAKSGDDGDSDDGDDSQD